MKVKSEFQKALEVVIDGYVVNTSLSEVMAEAIIELLENFDTTLEIADPGEMDGDHESALASVGWGTDESYGGSREG